MEQIGGRQQYHLESIHFQLGIMLTTYLNQHLPYPDPRNDTATFATHPLIRPGRPDTPHPLATRKHASTPRSKLPT